MTRQMLSSILIVLLGTGAIHAAHAAEPRPPAAPVQEDPLLKTVEPGSAPAPKRQRASSTGDKKVASDPNVQQDPLLRTVEPEAQAPATEKKPPDRSGKKAEPGQTVKGPGKKYKDSKVQEDPLLKTLDQK